MTTKKEPDQSPSMPINRIPWASVDIGESDKAAPVASLWYAVPVGAFVVSEIVNRFVLHQHMVLDFSLFQLLDASALQSDMFRSLLLLHGQPPLLNVLGGIVVKTASVLATSPEAVASAVFALSGLATAILLFHLTARWTRSKQLSCAAVLLYFAEPSYYGGSSAGVGRNFFFYEFVLQPVLLLVCWIAACWLRRPSLRIGLAFIVAVGVVVNTRTLFHPLLWGGGVTALVLIPRFRNHARLVAALASVALCLMTFWAVKNYFYFGLFTSSTWDGLNLDRGYAKLPKPLCDFDTSKPWPDATPLLPRFPRIASWPRESLTVVTSGTKPCGGPNWNNLQMAVSRNEAVRAGLAARRDLRHDLGNMAAMYKFATRAMYLHPYDGTAFNAYPDQFRGYLWFYDRLFFFPLTGSVRERNEVHWNTFGVFIVPALAIGSLLLAWLSKANRLLILVIAYTAFFPLISAVLSDGFEGNRMRHSTYPLMILLAAMVAAGAKQFAIAARSRED
jgi:hypothetical protein